MSDAGYSMLGAGAWGWPTEMLWGGRWEGGSCLGTHVRIKDFKIKKIKKTKKRKKEKKTFGKLKKKKEQVARIHRRTLQKNLHDPDNHDGVITRLEPDMLECEVKWALESITTNKASAGDGIPVELFQILGDDAVKVLSSICQQIWKTQQWPQDWKRSVFIPIPKKGNAKECSNYAQLHSSQR